MSTATEAETETEAEADRSTATRRTRRLWTAAIFAFVALEGATLQLQGAVLPSLGATFGAPAWQLGLVAPASTVGFLVCVAGVGAVAGRLDARRLLLVGVVGTGAAAFLVGLVPSFAAFLGVLTLRGAFAGVGRGTDRPLLGHLHPTRRGRLFGYYDMLWAVGATVGPLAAAAAVRLGSWRLAYLLLGVAFVPVAVLVWRLPTPSLGGGDDPLTLAGLRAVVRDRGVAVMAVAIVCTTSVEGGLFTWLTTFAGGRVPELATLSLSVLLVAYVPGRFVAARLADRVGPLPLAAGFATICALSLAATLLAATGPWLLVGVFCVGLSLSGLYPTLVAYATARRPNHSAPVNALALVVSSLGIAAAPAAIGVVAAGSGVGPAMQLLFVPAGALAAVTTGAWLYDRRSSQTAV